MNADTLYAAKLVVFSILIGLGIIGVVLRIREVRKENQEKNK